MSPPARDAVVEALTAAPNWPTSSTWWSGSSTWTAGAWRTPPTTSAGCGCTPTASTTCCTGVDPVASEDPMAFLPYAARGRRPEPAQVGATTPTPTPPSGSCRCFADPDPQPGPRHRAHPAALLPGRGRPRAASTVRWTSSSPGRRWSSAVPGSRGGARRRPRPPRRRRAHPARRWPGVPRIDLRDADGAPLDGGPAHGVPAGADGARRRVIGILWDGAHCGDLLHLAEAGRAARRGPADRARAAPCAAARSRSSPASP